MVVFQPGAEPPAPLGCKVVVKYQRPDVEVDIEFGESWRVEPTDELLRELEFLLGEKNAGLVY